MIGATVTRISRSESGGIIAWFLVSCLMFFALVVGAGVFIARGVRVHESNNGKNVQVETPFGSVNVSQNNNGRPESAGLPVYPGAKPMRNHENAVVDLSSFFGDKDLHIVAGRWETGDPIEKVRKFYQDRVPDMSVVQHDHKVEFHSLHAGSKRLIALYERDGMTEISLASVGEPRAN